MDIAEKLYQRGYLSYPRTETDKFKEGFDLQVRAEVRDRVRAEAGVKVRDRVRARVRARDSSRRALTCRRS